MHCDQPLATAKDSVKVFFLVNEQAASTGAHENLDAAGGTDGIQGFKIIDSRPNKKSKIGNTGRFCSRNLPIQLRLVDGGRMAIGHFKKARHTPPDRSTCPRT